MIRKVGVLVFALTFLLIYTTSALAIPTIGSGTNSFFFRNVENWVDTDDVGTVGYGVVSTGDYFYGILNMQEQLVDGVLAWEKKTTPATFDQLSGYFLTEVTGVSSPDPFDAGNALPHITLGAFTGVSDPYGVLLDAEIAAGGVMKLFSDYEATVGDPLTAYSTNDAGGAVGDIANATDGSLWATLSVTDGYWYSHAPAVLPANTSDFGKSFFGLNFIANLTGASFLSLDDPNEGEIGALVEMYGDSDLSSNDTGITGGTNWAFMSNDPAVVVTPEPSSLLLLGSGMVLGAGWLRRRRKKSKA